MSISETKHVSVLNYNDNYVTVPVSPTKSYPFAPACDGVPTSIPLTLDEIEYANNTPCFRNGTLEFPESIEQELYEKLNITDWKNILKLKDIEDIILAPTYEKLEKLLKIKDSSAFERVRGRLQKIQYDGKDVTVNVVRIIEKRYKELLRRQAKTDIVLSKKDVAPAVNTEEIDTLRIQNETMQEQLTQMQAMMAQMMATQNTNAKVDKAKDMEIQDVLVNEVVTPLNETVVKETPKKAGRPKKSP